MVTELDLTFRVDPETLREVFVSPADAEQWLDAALAEPRAGFYALMETGSTARLLGRLDLAEAEIESAASAAEQPVQRRLAAKELATVHAAQGRFGLAEEEFARCIADVPSPGDGLYLELEAAGKCAFEAGRWELARERFTEGLKLLAHTRSDSMTASLRVALAAAEVRLAAQEPPQTQ